MKVFPENFCFVSTHPCVSFCPGAMRGQRRTHARTQRESQRKDWRIIEWRNGFCILRIPYIISARGVWFTFIFRKQEHLAVGSWGKELTDSRGSLPLGLPCPPLLYSYYSTDLIVCQELFQKIFWWRPGQKTWLKVFLRAKHWSYLHKWKF